MFSLKLLFEVGSVLVIIAGILGAFMGGYRASKGKDAKETNEVLQLKDRSIQALRDEVGALSKRVGEQEEKMKHITEINNAYIRLFSGNPSRLEEYMKTTADAIKAINDKIITAPTVNVVTGKQ